MPKEEMNAFDVRALVQELGFLTEGRFDKAYQPSREEVVLRFYVPKAAAPDVGGEGTRKDLAIMTGRWACLTRYPRENPTKPPQFPMLLRKHVSGGAVLDVRQHGFDRVVEVDVGKRDGTYTLVVELFHDGNVVLVQQDGEPAEDAHEGDEEAEPPLGRIVTTLLHQDWAHRTVRPGKPFRHAPGRVDPFSLDYEGFREVVLGSDADAVRTLAVELNLGGTYAEEVCARTDLDKHAPVAELLESELEALFAALRSVLERFEVGDLDPVLVLEEGKPVDCAPFPLRAFEGRDLERCGSFNEALDRLFSEPVTREREDTRLQRFREEREKVERRLHQQESAIDRFEREEVELKRKGDVLYAHFDTVQRILRTILDASREHGWDVVKERLREGREAGNPDAERVQQVNPHEGQVTVRLEDMDGEPLDITLDVRETVQANAERLYERGKAMRGKRTGASEALERTRAQLAEMEEKGTALLEEIEARRSRAEATHRFWFETFRWFVSSEGHLVLGGRDASTNDQVVKRHLEANDRYVHADVHGAPSVVVKAKDGATPGEATLEEACQWAAATSRLWSAGAGGGEAYWVTPPQVSQTPEAGEFLPKGAFIVRGKRNLHRAPLEHAVGEVEVEGHRKVMGGPPAAVTSRSDAYVLLEPGREDRNEVANRLAGILQVPVEEVQAVLPPGDVRVTEVYGLPEEEVRGG